LWSASQAVPIRRVIINGNVVFQDYCSADNYASGGFIADSQISGALDFYGNQQYMVRNSDIGGSNGCGGPTENAASGTWSTPALRGRQRRLSPVSACKTPCFRPAQ
jgi:hypothetical protein